MSRRVAVVTAAAVMLGGLGAVAAAHASPDWNAATVGTPRGYFDFCQDKQRDIAGITAADLAGDNNGGNAFGIAATIYPNLAPGASLTEQNDLEQPGFSEFVSSKSGITVTAADGPARQILVAQFVEFRDSAAEHPTQIRCKLRTQDSLNTAGFQHLDNGNVTTVPWGFGSGTATGTGSSCAAVNADSVQNAWNQLSETQKDDADFRPEPRDGDPVNLSVEPDFTRPGMAGPDWTQPWDALQVDGGVLKVRAKRLDVPVDYPGAADRLRGAAYCTFVAPEYLVDVFKNNVVPPTPPVPGPGDDPDTP